ncbi:putative uncharacterized protein DDB_G0282133 [Polistes fuscatus]|uniref:putative uncharacterized protein DDB_G0282133 n=1 Tax=Polistes fuscatus TaxID=30207 RepID=UPI001CAA28BF|nr:putative uncharacterized protein DDB_G0282133 [Polistes fuscatus]
METKKKHSVASNCKTKRRTNSSRKKKYLPEQHKYLQSRLQLKDLHIVLHNIATNGLIPPHQKYLTTKQNNVGKIIDNSKENESIKINSNKKINPKKRSSIEKKKKAKKDKVKRRLFDDTNPSCNKKQETCPVKPLFFNHNDNMKEYDFNINNKYKCTEKHSNEDTCIVKINSDRNLCNDISNNKVSILNRDDKNGLKKEDLNCKKDTKINFVNNENFMKNEHLDKITHSKFSKKLQDLPLIFENFNEINLPKCNKVSVIPKIVNDYILHKNKVIVIKDVNNLHHKDYSRMMIKNIEINKPYSVELSNEVAELTVDNLHKFTVNYQENHQQLQINRSLNATDISSLNSINNKDKDMMQKMSKNNSTISYTKRKWFGQNRVTQFNQTNKKFKLDRSFVNNKSLSATNNFLYVNENSNPSFKYDNVIINANAIQDIDNNSKDDI